MIVTRLGDGFLTQLEKNHLKKIGDQKVLTIHGNRHILGGKGINKWSMKSKSTMRDVLVGVVLTVSILLTILSGEVAVSDVGKSISFSSDSVTEWREY